MQQGDGEAFTDLATGIGPRLLGIAFGILRDRSLAEDATQQALVQVWRKLPRLRGLWPAQSGRVQHLCGVWLFKMWIGD